MGDLLIESARQIEALQAENGLLRKAIRDNWVWARRYCDGRMTYATSGYNDATRALMAAGVLPPDWADPMAETPWARDGMGAGPGGLSAAEHDRGRPVEAWQRRATDEQVAEVERRIMARAAAQEASDEPGD